MLQILNQTLGFQQPRTLNDQTSVVAIRGDLHPKRLLLAYSMGIFPWYNEDQSPIIWQSPENRMVLFPDQIYINRTLKKWMKKHPFEIKYDTNFRGVLDGCSSTPRPGQDGTWLNENLKKSFEILHEMGFAHSVETWRDGKLVGGLYGLTMGGVFFGESMFAHEDYASKTAFLTLVPQLLSFGYRMIDCQVYTRHLDSFGAIEMPRNVFLGLLDEELKVKPRQIWPSSCE